MKVLAWGVVTLGSVALSAACGGGGSGGGGGGGAGGDGTTTGSTTVTGSTTASSTTTTSSSTVTTGTSCGSAVLDPNDSAGCQTCLEASCCAEMQACDTGSACAELLDCLHECGDQACSDDCIANGQAGVPNAQTLINCFEDSCAAAPACATGEICDAGLEAPDAACGTCLGDHCCQEYKDCVADGAINGCLRCVLGTAADPAACQKNALYQAIAICRSTSCGSTCGGGICDSGLSSGDEPCDACIGASCCQEIKDCANDDATGGCFDACLSAQTKDPACSDPNDPLGALYLPYKNCYHANCDTACGG